MGSVSFDTIGDDGEPAPPARTAKGRLLQSTPHRVGVLGCGDAMVFDSRTLHCGGANTSSRRRVLFYFSFKANSARYLELGQGATVGTLDEGLAQCAPLHLDCRGWLRPIAAEV